MENKIEKVFISWDTIHDGCITISDQIKNIGQNFDLILSVGRGGMIPSRLIAENLNINHIEIFNCHSYTDINQPGKMISEPFNYKILEGKSILVVDDVYTTGNTLNYVCNNILSNVDEINITVTTVYQNKRMRDLEMSSDLWAYEYDSECQWLVFPWESN